MESVSATTAWLGHAPRSLGNGMLPPAASQEAADSHEIPNLTLAVIGNRAEEFI